MIDSRQLSIKINEVFNHLCVNDEMIQSRRKCLLQLECADKVYFITSLPPEIPVDAFYFGSQSEGTTTFGLNSDVDIVCIRTNIVVITDRIYDIESENMYKLHMDKYTNKGYCCLLDKNSKEVWQKNFPPEYRRDNYIKNSYQVIMNVPGIKLEREGPAVYYNVNGQDFNLLNGFCCSSWPREVSNTFLLNQEKLYWPSDQLLQDVLQSRCFVVPKGRDTGPDSDIEWRLSFSLGERLLMSDLNIVQIRCYVLMKFVKTTFLDNVQDCKGIISSYICKTVLFHTVSKTENSEWVEENLLLNFIKCLSHLKEFIDKKNCKHFIMPYNNLLENKLNEATHSRLSKELQRIIESNEHRLLDIQIDDFGDLLKRTDILNYLEQKDQIYQNLLNQLIYKLFTLNMLHNHCLNESVQAYEGKIKLLEQLHQSTPVSEENMHVVIKTLVGRYSTLIGSLLASNNIKYKHDLSDKAFQWFLLGMMCTDKASAHLKLASVMFLIGDFDSTFILLSCTVKKLNEHSNVYVCRCKHYPLYVFEFQSQRISRKPLTDIIRENIKTCVIYSPDEMHCCPKELQYEFFRAYFNEIPQEYWMEFRWLSFAIIPQEPYCLFLQYKLYKQLGMQEKCNQVLFDLAKVPSDTKLYLNHRETVYNLIGQCVEQEGYFNLALHYYYKSLQVEPTYNAAKILICCNLCQQLQRNTMSLVKVTS